MSTLWVVERTFCSINHWFGSGKNRYKGLLVCMPSLLWRLELMICIVPLGSLSAFYKNRYN
ncbi:MAG: hypothetical protein ACMUEL_07220 [Flavobacteriales bacterium Tduv]